MDKGETVKKQKKSIQILRTLKTDTSDYVKKKGISMVDIAMAGRNKKTFLSFKKKKGIFSGKSIIITAAILFFIGGGLLIFLSARRGAEPNSAVKVAPKPIITADKEESVSVEKIGSVLEIPVPRRKLLNISVFSGNGKNKKTILSIKEFFSEAGVSAPRAVVDSLDGKFMFGVFRSSAKSPVLILKVKFFGRAFASMMDWESSMFEDLGPILGGGGADLNPGGFTDKEIKNTDARVLYDDKGKPVLIYAFFGKKYLVITTSESALIPILRRLSSPRYLNG